jgi:serine/threonine protein kinase
LIDIDWHAKLCDFSFACHEECTNKKDYIYGTEEFMSPEMALAMDFDKSSDIFSYGIMLCELITGIEPSKTFLHRRPQDLFEMNEQEVRDAVPEECPEALEALALQCCDSEPSKRPSAATCVEELTALLEELGGAENILDFQPDHLPQPLVLSSLSPMREGNVITPATPAAEYNLRRPSAMTTFMGYDQRYEDGTCRANS